MSYLRKVPLLIRLMYHVNLTCSIELYTHPNKPTNISDLSRNPTYR